MKSKRIPKSKVLTPRVKTGKPQMQDLSQFDFGGQVKNFMEDAGAASLGVAGGLAGGLTGGASDQLFAAGNRGLQHMEGLNQQQMSNQNNFYNAGRIGGAIGEGAITGNYLGAGKEALSATGSLIQNNTQPKMAWGGNMEQARQYMPNFPKKTWGGIYPYGGSSNPQLSQPIDRSTNGKAPDAWIGQKYDANNYSIFRDGGNTFMVQRNDKSYNSMNYDPKYKFVPYSDTKKFSQGGQVYNGEPTAEVEKEELMRFPDGSTTQTDGPPHSSGGVPVNLPQNTQIFSDRLKPDGEKKTFAKIAERFKTNREEKLLDDDNSSKETKESANLMFMAKNKALTSLFQAQEQQKQAKVQAYAKKMGVQMPQAGQQPQMQGQPTNEEGNPEMANGGQMDKYQLGSTHEVSDGEMQYLKSMGYEFKIH